MRPDEPPRRMSSPQTPPRTPPRAVRNRELEDAKVKIHYIDLVLLQGLRKELWKKADFETLGRSALLIAKQMPPACLSRRWRWFLFLDLRKNIYKKKLGNFENPWTKFFRDHVFSNWDFPSQSIHKKLFYFLNSRIWRLQIPTNLSLGLTSSEIL